MGQKNHKSGIAHASSEGELPFHAHVERLGRVAKRLSVSPAALTGTILKEWFAWAYPSLSTGYLPVRKGLHNNTDVRAFVAMLSQQSLLHAAYWLSSAYAKFVGHERRKSLSLFFTPPSLAARLLDELQSQGVAFDRGTFCDPACGGAAFLVPIALRMKSALKAQGVSDGQIIRHVESSLYGIDLDPTLCELSKQFLRAALYDEIRRSQREPKFKILQGNALQCTENLYDSVDVFICNPPYRKMSAAEVAKVSDQYGNIIRSQPNIYGLFIALGLKLVKKGGVCALVTPTSFLSGHSFANLRCFLMENAELLTIGVVGDRTGVFIDVEQETALTVLRRRHIPNNGPVNAAISLVSATGDYAAVGSCVLPNSGAAWPIPRLAQDVALLETCSHLVHRLVDYGYSIRIGHFVWNRDKRRTYISKGTAQRFKRKTAVPLLWSSDIRPDGTIHFDGARKHNGESRFVDLGTRKHPAVIKHSSVVLQRVTSNDQPRRLIAAAVPLEFVKRYGGFVGENHVVILEPCVERPMISARQLVRLFGTKSVDRYFRCISGATNVSIFELNQLPLPDPVWLKRALAKGVAIEAAMSEAMQGLGQRNNQTGKKRVPAK